MIADLRRAMPLLLGLAFVSCSEDEAILLTVDGDLRPGVDLDALELRLLREGAELWASDQTIGLGESFPRRARIARPSSEEDVVELTVTARLEGRDVMVVRRPAAFAHGTETSARVCLWQRCAGSTSQACAEGRCDGAPSDGDADADSDGGDGGEPDGSASLCSETCAHAWDGICQDGGEGSLLRWCDFGTDCTDCGDRAGQRCAPDCEGRSCGADGCGGECGPGCEGTRVCAGGGRCVDWIAVPAQTFAMGAPEDEDRMEGEFNPRHDVTLTRGFIIAAHEASQAWVTAILGRNHSTYEGCDSCSADGVIWHDAALFCNVLSTAEGLERCYECGGSWPDWRCELAASVETPYDCEGYRLPTEAEWELAARGGTATATYNGDLHVLGCEAPNPTLDSIAWFCGNAPDLRPQPPALLEANAFGLFDMLGNVIELTDDGWSALVGPATDPWHPPEGNRVCRGGAATSDARMVRAAFRAIAPATTRVPTIGFRPARTTP